MVLGSWCGSKILLLNNALAPWFIIVPETDVDELYQLSQQEQQLLQRQINRLSAFLKEEMLVDKLNVAAIGNIVSQLHIHVVGRSVGDFCWPGVVWGAGSKKPYDDATVVELRHQLQAFLGGELLPDSTSG